MVKVVKIAIIALSGLGISIFLAIAIPKILYSYEMHWMEGSILDQIQRLLDNKPLYSKPSIYYVPWLYPPLYYYVAAKFASLFGLSYFIARLPSVISTLALCFILWKIVKKETANRVFAFGAIGLFVASYARTEFKGSAYWSKLFERYIFGTCQSFKIIAAIWQGNFYQFL